MICVFFLCRQYGNYQAQASEPDAVVVAAPEANQARDGKALAYAQAQTYQQGKQFAQQQYGQQEQQVGPDGKYEEPEPTVRIKNSCLRILYHNPSTLSLICNAHYPIDHHLLFLKYRSLYTFRNLTN